MKKDKIKIGLLVVHITDDNVVRQKMVVTHLCSDGIDVIDDFFGRQFNTYDYAHQTAIKFMKQLNEQKP
jgi:hypothetical protein